MKGFIAALLICCFSALAADNTSFIGHLSKQGAAWRLQIDRDQKGNPVKGALDLAWDSPSLEALARDGMRVRLTGRLHREKSGKRILQVSKLRPAIEDPLSDARKGIERTKNAR